MLNIIEGLTFDDLLLIPKYSTLDSRSEVDLTVAIKTKTGVEFKFNTPIIPANMLHIATLNMMQLMYSNRSLGLLHRFVSFEEQLKMLEIIKDWGKDELSNNQSSLNYIGFSVGIQPDDYVRVAEFTDWGAKIICIDVANCACDKAVKLINYVATKYPDILLIAGNVAMGREARILWRAGADIVKCNIGSGSICTTRTTTANGVPSITSIDSCAEAKQSLEKELNRKLYLIADGGMKRVADVCLALAVGADFTMLGNMFSGCDEASTEIVELDGKKFAAYAGSSTFKNTHKEGVRGAVKLKGPGQNIINKICEGLRSCCSYQNVRNLIDLKKDPQFIRVSANGLKENGAHDLDHIL